MNRETLPASLKRQILVESGHRCAIPTCRYPTVEIAHIVPYSKVKNHEYHNLIALCPNCHARFDTGKIDKKSIEIYKKKLVFLSDRYSRYELNVLSNLYKKGKMIIAGEQTVINLLDNNLIEQKKVLSSFTYDDGTEEILEFVSELTQLGIDFIKQWIDPNNSDQTY